jgi:ABC-type phosphate transport system substrate-binding protein
LAKANFFRTRGAAGRKKSEDEVLKYISENPGAIGYVAEPTAIDHDILKVLTIKEK